MCLSHTQSRMTDPDSETTAAPCHIPPWALNEATTAALRDSGHGVSPDLIYARGVPNSPQLHSTTFDKKQCSLLLIEVGFGADLNLKRKIEEKTAKYQPLIQALSEEWGRVTFVCIPIGHAGTLLSESALHLAEALASKRPNLGRKRPRTDNHSPETDKLALTHDKKIMTALLQQLSDLAATRLLQILAHRQIELHRLSPISPPPFAPRKRRTDPSSTAIT